MSASSNRKLNLILAKPLIRLLLSLGLAIAAYVLIATPWWEIRILAAFNLGLFLHLGILGTLLWNATPAQTYRHAQGGEPSNVALLTVVVLFSLSGFVGVAVMLDNSQKYPPLITNLHMGLSLLAIFSSWLLVHIYFALHYAHLYYDEIEESAPLNAAGVPYRKGLDFPHEGLVSYRDFLYYSFTIAMCYQTSDVSIISYEMRSVSLVQSVLSFIFVAVVFGLVVNVISNVV
ncbi:DUF1345 domain-containing protein [Thermosynechococcaceae cyanobacterium BACA0444]|uniref:DUF1345 domain-containing protein n=1 Tax=Pseudocalidococcus azoricus BACA0444 TaxID=2918990 RepID=A0AAE4JUT2_9CYAN|nr:DUF1345 domain-containing protein [Pseudocalidococcus azoricus]MDS3859620.1 DUF1345 domain-containing protein [Pseudocalidococcus azoricus BACA0444]